MSLRSTPNARIRFSDFSIACSTHALKGSHFRAVAQRPTRQGREMTSLQNALRSNDA